MSIYLNREWRETAIDPEKVNQNSAYQMRVKGVDSAQVAVYIQAMKRACDERGASRYAETGFPPIRCARYDGQVIVIDGNHRKDAAQEVFPRQPVPALIVELPKGENGRRELFLLLAHANASNGKSRSKEDLHKACRMAFEVKSEWDFTELADLLGVSDKTAKKIAQKILGQEPEPKEEAPASLPASLDNLLGKLHTIVTDTEPTPANLPLWEAVRDRLSATVQALTDRLAVLLTDQLETPPETPEASPGVAGPVIETEAGACVLPFNPDRTPEQFDAIAHWCRELAKVPKGERGSLNGAMSNNLSKYFKGTFHAEDKPAFQEFARLAGFSVGASRQRGIRAE